MDKFTDGFSNKSYEDLLDEYAGESLANSKISMRSEAKQPPKRKAEDVNVYSSRSEIKTETEKKQVREPVKKAVTELIRKSDRTSAPLNRPDSYVQKKAESNSSFGSKAFNFREIKSFDDELKYKKTAVTENKKPLSSSDTMEFKKGKTNTNIGKLKKPVIDKENKPESEKSQNVKWNKIANKMIEAVKVNKRVFVTLAVCLVISVLVSVMLISCVNDVLAIGRKSDQPIEIVLPNNADTDTALDVLKDAKLIKNKFFCSVFIKAMGYSDKNYLPGVYYFTPDMGVEKMIKRFKTSSTRGALISITIPEGYTIDKIFERLEKNNICTASALYKTIDEVDFSKEYKFIPSAESKKDCYHVLEGYFFPATYEFEQGADPATVVRAFLNAFQQHWTDEYAKRAEELGMSVDDIVNLASIIEKEGANTSQFTLISSVIHNRLNRSGLYPFLGCNSTKDYVTNTISARVSSKAELNSYIQNYNTYEREGLPAGSICNPGIAAIESALYPDSTQYYFFAHDNKKKIYMAETMEQHDANLRTIAQVNAQK